MIIQNVKWRISWNEDLNWPNINEQVVHIDELTFYYYELKNNFKDCLKCIVLYLIEKHDQMFEHEEIKLLHRDLKMIIEEIENTFDVN